MMDINSSTRIFADDATLTVFTIIYKSIDEAEVAFNVDLGNVMEWLPIYIHRYYTTCIHTYTVYYNSRHALSNGLRGSVSRASHQIRGVVSSILTVKALELHFSQLISVESYTFAKYPYRLPLQVIECKIPILFLIYSIHSPALPPFTYILEILTRSQQRPSWLTIVARASHQIRRGGGGVRFSPKA